MEILDLNHLNIISPYALWKTGSNGNEYAFHTDYGVQYRICFDVNQSIWENGAYEFGIYNDVCAESIFHYRCRYSKLYSSYREPQ